MADFSEFNFTTEPRVSKPQTIDKEVVRNAANGQWQSILAEFGANPLHLNGKHHPCPSCGGTDRFRFDNKDGRGTYLCNQCGSGDGFSLAGKLLGKNTARDFPEILIHVGGLVGVTPSDSILNQDQIKNRQKVTQANAARILKDNEDADRRKVASQKEAAKTVKIRMNRAQKADQNHPYLKKKNVSQYGLQQEGNLLLVPMLDESNDLVNIQTIDADGKKLFQKDCRVKGCLFQIGALLEGQRIVIAEGFATGASVHDATGLPVIIAFTVGNIFSVATTIRSRFKESQIIIAADNDHQTPGNPGVSKATETAKKINGLLVVPDINLLGSGTDFNDLAMLHGHDAVRAAFESIADVGEMCPNDEWPEPKTIDGIVDEPLPYPVDALPDVVWQAAVEVARFAKVPEVSPAVIGLSVAAASIGKKARIEERPGLYHHPALFLAIIAPSGERKSPPFKIMSSPLENWGRDSESSYKNELIEVQVQNRVIDKLTATLEREAAKKDMTDDYRETLVAKIAGENAKRRPIPPHPRLFTTDTTEERLFQKMHENKGAFAVLSGEGRPVLDSIMGKHSGSGRTGDAIYLSGISGDTITRDRVGGDGGPEERVIYDPCLNVCIMIQPDKFLEVARHPTLKASGALARIWPVSLPSLVGSRFETADEPGLREETFKPYRETIIKLLEAKIAKKGDTPIPHLVRLSSEAIDARRFFHNSIEKMMGGEQELADFRELASKATSATCKIAMVIHLVQNPHFLAGLESELSLETWEKAQRLGAYHLTEAVNIQRNSGDDADFQRLITVGKWLIKKEIQELKASYLSQMGPRPRLSTQEAEAMLETMEALLWVRAEPSVPGQRKPLYRVNPKISQLSQFSQGIGVK